MGHSGARILFVDAEMQALVRPSTGRGSRRCESRTPAGPATRTRNTWPRRSPEPLARRLEDEEEMIAINYTSGTTGRPKGVMYTHRGAYLNALGGRERGDASARSISGPCRCSTATAGASLGASPRSAARTSACARSSRAGSWTCSRPRASPTTAAPDGPARPRQRQRATGSTGRSPPRSRARRPRRRCSAAARSLQLRSIHLYGLTETYGPTTICAWRGEWDGLR